MTTTTTLTRQSVFDNDEEFWQKYLKGRPTPPDSLFDLILDYHSSKRNAHFGTVHDCGAGVGVHSLRICTKFRKALVSDASEQTIVVARDRLKLSKISAAMTLVAKAEETEWLEPESVDLFFAANVLHLTDLEQSMKAVNYQLKPGGTFAATLFAVPLLYDARAQDVWYKTWQKGFDRTLFTPTANKLKKGESEIIPGITCVAGFYDGISLSNFQTNAIRYNFNVPGEEDSSWYRMFVPPGRESFAPYGTAIEPEDVLIRQEQAGWEFKGDLQGLKDCTASFPMFGDGSEFESLWKDMGDIIEDRIIEGVFHAALLLATKK